MKNLSSMRLSFLSLILTAIVLALFASGCEDRPDLTAKAKEAIGQADKVAANADEIIKKAKKAVNDAEADIKEAQEADDEKAMAFATTKLNIANNAKKKAENAKRKAEKAKAQAKKAKNNNAQEDLDNAKENNSQAKDLADEASGILKDIDGIAGARKKLEDLGFTKKEIDKLLKDLNDSMKDPDDGTAFTPTGQPGLNEDGYRRVVGNKLREKEVDMSTPEGKKKLKSATKAIKDLFHAEGKVGDGMDAPYTQ